MPKQQSTNFWSQGILGVKISIFGGISKFLKRIVFGQILTKFGSSGQFWVDSTAMAVANSKPSFEREKRIRHNLCKKCQNFACDGLLESPLNFPSTKKVSKNPITNWNCSCVPKVSKFHIWNSQSFTS
jgi:hypothetical protein